MAQTTVDSLLLQTQVDDSGLTAQFNAQIREVNRLTEQVNRASSAMKPITILADVQGLSAAERSVIAKIDAITQAVNAIPPAQFQIDTTGVDADVAHAIAKIEVFAEALRQVTDIGSFDKSEVLGGIADQLAVDAQAFRASTVEAAALEQTIRHLRAESEALRSAGPMLPPDQFAAFRGEAAATNVAIAELTAAMARGNRGNLDYAVGLAQAETQLKETNAALAESAARQRQFAEASRQASLTPFNRGLEEVRLTGAGMREELGRGAQSTVLIGQGAERSATGFKTMAASMTSLAAQTVGVQSQFGLLAENILFFGLGGPVVLGLAAGALAVVAAYEAITKSIHEARKATDEFIQAQANAARAADPIGKVREAFSGIDEAGGRKIEGLTERMVRLNAQLKELRQGEQVPTGAGGSVLFIDDAAIAKVKQKIEDLKTAAAKTGTDFLDPVLRAQQSATVQGIADNLALRQQGFQSEEAALRAHLALMQATTVQGTDQQLQANAQFFDSLKGLRVQAEAAEEKALRDKISAQETTTPRTPVEKIQQDATIRGLQAQIDLRKQTLATQLQAIDNEHAIADAVTQGTVALQHRMDAERIARSGGGNVLGGAPPVREERFIPTNIPEGAFQLPAILQGIQQSGVTRDLEAGLIRDQQAADRLSRALHSVVDNVTGLLGVAGAVLGIGQAGEEAIRSIGGVVSGVVDLKKAAADKAAAANITDPAEKAAALQTAGLEKFAAVAGIVGQGISLLGGILGHRSEAELERIRVEQVNSDRIQALTAEIGKIQGLGGLAAARATIGELAAQQGLLNLVQATGGRVDSGGRVDRGGLSKTEALLGNPQDKFQAVLDAAGINLRDFAAEVKQATGIELLDKKGRLVASAFDAATRAIDLMVKAALTLSTDPGAVRARLEAEDSLRIGGRSADPQVAAAQREREVILQGVNLSAQEEARIRGINLETAKGRAEFLKWEQDLARRAETPGGITATELQDFHTPDELILALAGGADAVNAFADSLHAVTDQMSNVPRSFKQAAAASAAEIAGLGPNAPLSPEPRRLRGTDFTPPVNFGRSGDGASLPDLVSVLKSADLPSLARAIKGAREKAPLITGNVVNQTFPFVPGDIREFARLVAIAMKELGTADNSSSGNPWDRS